MKAAAEAFSPAGISSFFEICDTAYDGSFITDLQRIGARGGGFVIQKGVNTRVEVNEAKTSSTTVFINGKPAPEAETTTTVADELLGRTTAKYAVSVMHRVEVPIGAGFGSSAAGALGTALALANVLELKLTYNQLGKIAHEAEVKCKTGLGTVGPIMLGGCILTVEPGAPGIGVIDRIQVPPDCMIVAGTFDSTPTKGVLSSPRRRQEINFWGKKTLAAILDEPSIENFLARCYEFAEKTGFITEHVRRLVRVAEREGAIGAAQNMVGEAVHALVRKENFENVAEAFKELLPTKKITVTKIDFQGARLM